MHTYKWISILVNRKLLCNYVYWQENHFLKKQLLDFRTIPTYVFPTRSIRKMANNKILLGYSTTTTTYRLPNFSLDFQYTIKISRNSRGLQKQCMLYYVTGDNYNAIEMFIKITPLVIFQFTLSQFTKYLRMVCIKSLFQKESLVKKYKQTVLFCYYDR